MRPRVPRAVIQHTPSPTADDLAEVNHGEREDMQPDQDAGADPWGGGSRGRENFLTPLFLERTNLKVWCNLFSSRYKTNFFVKSAYSLGKNGF